MSNQKTSSKYKLLILFILFVIFITTIFLFLLINRKKTDSINLVLNHSFEEWEKGVPSEWINNDAFLFDIVSSISDGNHAVGIYSKDTTRNGIHQTIKLDPTETYYVYFSLKSNSYSSKNIGFQITYEGDKVKNSSEIKQGIHFYDKAKDWRQYSGSVIGAKAIRLFFFSSNSSILYVDAVWVGTNFPPLLHQKKQLTN